MFSWQREIAMEGNTEHSVPLLPYEQSLLTRLSTLLMCHPEQYLSDAEDIDMDDFKSRINSLVNRLVGDYG